MKQLRTYLNLEVLHLSQRMQVQRRWFLPQSTCNLRYNPILIVTDDCLLPWPRKTLSPKDIEDHDIFIMSPQAVHNLDPQMREFWMDRIGMILVDEGDLGTANR